MCLRCMPTTICVYGVSSIYVSTVCVYVYMSTVYAQDE